MIRIELPFPPSQNAIWRSGRGRVYRAKSYTNWLTQAYHEWLAQKPKGPFKTVEGLFDIELKFSRPDRRKRDLDNYHKVVTDFLQQAQIIKNDCNMRKTTSMWVADEEAPMGVVVLLTPVSS